MLIYNNKLYIFKKVFIREKLLKRYYNKLLARYFEFDKIFKLRNKEYY